MIIDDVKPFYFKQESLIFFILLVQRLSLFAYSILVKNCVRLPINASFYKVGYQEYMLSRC